MVRVAVEHGRDFIVDITLNLGRIEIVDLRVRQKDKRW